MCVIHVHGGIFHCIYLLSQMENQGKEMAWILFAEYTADVYLLYIVLYTIASGPLLAYLELSGKLQLSYSKFGTDKEPLGSIPSKLAMFLYYAPPAALAASLISFKLVGYPDLNGFMRPEQPSLRFLVLSSAVFVHFFKRVLEVLFVHKYSGNAGVFSSFMIMFFYTFSSVVLLYAQDVAEVLAPPSLNLMWVGIVFFLVGITGNFYHHYLLAQLRSGKKQDDSGHKRYAVPHGGLFELVACPHYLFEIVDFMGLAMISQTTVGFCTFCLVASYLISRSISTRQWYSKKIDGFPESRKAIIPYIL